MDHQDLFARQRQAILDGNKTLAVELAQKGIDTGVDLAASIEMGYVTGIQEVGRLWADGEYFLPELVQGAEAMKAAMALLRPRLLAGSAKVDSADTVILGTAQGDIHDIGKALVATLLEANGFRVVDLGRDVSDEAFVEAAHTENARIIGMSALLTTTMPAQTRVIKRLEESGIRDRLSVMVGGAPVTRAYAHEIGADGYAADAMAAVVEAQRLVQSQGPVR